MSGVRCGRGVLAAGGGVLAGAGLSSAVFRWGARPGSTRVARSPDRYPSSVAGNASAEAAGLRAVAAAGRAGQVVARVQACAAGWRGGVTGAPPLEGPGEVRGPGGPPR